MKKHVLFLLLTLWVAASFGQTSCDSTFRVPPGGTYFFRSPFTRSFQSLGLDSHVLSIIMDGQAYKGYVPGRMLNDFTGFTAGHGYQIARKPISVDTATLILSPTAVFSSNAFLSGLVVPGITLTPSFAQSTLSYTASVANSVTSATVIPTLAESHATVRVKGTAVASGAASPAITLTEGANTIPVAVTAQDNIAGKNYNVVITRDAAISQSVFNPVFEDYGLNVYRDDSPTAYKNVSEYAKLSYTTDATEVTLTLYNTNPDQTYQQGVGVFINGVWLKDITTTTVGNLVDVTATLPAGNKTVTFEPGLESVPYPVIGIFINKVNFPSGTTNTLIAPNNGTNRVVVIGNSIPSGATASNLFATSWFAKVRANADYNSTRSIALYGWGGNSVGAVLHDRLTETVTNTVNYLAGAATKEVDIDLVTNDAYLNGGVESAANCTDYLNTFLTALHTADPAITVRLFTGIVRNDNTSLSSNNYGNYLEDYNKSIESSAITNSSFTTSINQRYWVSGTNLSDGIHPNDVGYNENYTNRMALDNVIRSVPSNLTFTQPTAMLTGDADQVIKYGSNNQGAISATSSNAAVATIVNGKIHAVGGGTTTITIHQSAFAGWSAANDVTRILTVTAGAPIYAVVQDKVFIDLSNGWAKYIVPTDGTGSNVTFDLDGGITKAHLIKLAGAANVQNINLNNTALFTPGDKLRITFSGVNVISGTFKVLIGNGNTGTDYFQTITGDEVLLLDTTGYTGTTILFGCNGFVSDSGEAYIREIKVEKQTN